MEEKYTAANWAAQLFSSPQCHVFTFSVHLGLSPAWKLRLNLCAPLLRVCKWTRTSVCTCTPLAVPGFSALLFQPGVSKFWFPLGPPRNWKQRLSLEVCLVCVCVLSACVRVYMCSEACSLCFCTSSLCTYAFIYQDISACPFANTSYVYAHACVLPTCRSSETSQRAWWMNKIRALGVSSIFASHAELEAWPEAVQVSGYL